MQDRQYDGVVLADKWGKTYLCSSCLLARADLGEDYVTAVKDSEFGRYFLHDLEPSWNLRQLWAEMYQQAKPWVNDLSKFNDFQLRDALLQLFALDEMWIWQLSDGWGQPPKGNGIGEGGLAPASGSGAGPAPVAKTAKPGGGATTDAPVAAKAASHEAKSPPVAVLPLNSRRNNPPATIEDAATRLTEMKSIIATNGYQPKYTDAELATMAESGNVANERFHVRFMKKSYLQDPDTPAVPLSGKLGQVMKGESGAGAKYWSTTFDQIEDADTDAELISNKLGLKYEPGEYVMLIIDTDKAAPLTGVKSVSATFNNISEFANTELPDAFPASFTDKTMNAEYQALYAEQYKKAVDSKMLATWSTNTDDFAEYLETTDFTDEEKETLMQRMDMHKKVGNNDDYLGNGVTKDLTNSKNQYGAVETINFERTEIDLKTLNDNNAIVIVDL
uniref:Uropathogenic specific protein n=1 Tax=Rheinheimera sp. BAL341 TaxID=1708203 RepID=A0A486XR87_9GAMM